MLKFQNKIPAAIIIGGKIVERIKMNDEVVWGRVQTPLYIQNTYNGTNTISVKQTITGSPDSGAYAKHLQYSKDGLNWTTITLSSTAYTISLTKNERVYFRGNERVFNYWYSGGAHNAITTITGTQNHTVGGNINTLLDYTDPYGLILPQGAFNSMFRDDTKLTSASDITLPASADGSLPTYCYLYLFSGCSSLTTPPSVIPATKQGRDACNNMFANCTSLTSAPALPAKTLANYCYKEMFNNTAITTAPELPATVLAQYCYQGMFKNNAALTTAPALPATTLADNCYYSMFEQCSKLTSAPALPATTLALNCYRSLFFGCSSLVNPPELPAKVLAEGCYQNLFRDCTLINSVTVYADDNSATNCTALWLRNVASSGTFTNYGSATYTTNSDSGIPTGWTEVNDPTDYFYIENTYNGTNNIYLKTRAGYAKTEPTGEFATSLQYSKDKKTWTTINLNYEYTSGSSTLKTKTNLTLSLNKGEKVYFRNTSGYFSYVNDIDMATDNWGTHAHMFSSDESIKTAGNIKSLLDYRDMNGTTLKKGCFYALFSGAENLKDASGLTLGDTVAESCYMKLFENCYSLTTYPSLPATTMAPRCYQEMFKNTAIASTPELPATTLAPYCYKNIFESCSVFRQGPVLPATTLSTGCYQGMFNGCSNLTSAPVLKATTLAEYSYRYMFMGCSKLNSVNTFANDISANECTRWWLEGVASSGLLYSYGTATYTKNSSDGVPSGWTLVK